MERKYVQIMKDDGFVTLIGDEQLGMVPTDNDIVLIFDISSHPQNAEIEPWMKYDKDKNEFYWPEPIVAPEEPGNMKYSQSERDEFLEGVMEGSGYESSTT